jgi:hypothetical protein
MIDARPFALAGYRSDLGEAKVIKAAIRVLSGSDIPRCPSSYIRALRQVGRQAQ